MDFLALIIADTIISVIISSTPTPIEGSYVNHIYTPPPTPPTQTYCNCHTDYECEVQSVKQCPIIPESESE